MTRAKSTSLAVLAVFLWPMVANADVISITVEQDVSLASDRPDNNENNPGHEFLWVGDNTGNRDYQGMFGFDMSSLTSLLGTGETLIINSFDFWSYNNFNSGAGGDVEIALGNTDVWDADVVTWNSSASDHGGSIDSIFMDATDVNSYVSWDVSSVDASAFLSDDYLTFYLYILNVGDGNNWHDFENEEWTANNESYLDIDYTIVSVPEPGTLALLGIGLFGMGLARRRKQI